MAHDMMDSLKRSVVKLQVYIQRKDAMMRIAFALVVLAFFILNSGCQTQRSFNEDVRFLEKYVEVITLASDDSSAQVAVVPQYQGRVMTSTAGGRESFGWLNYEAIASKEIQPHINIYGGEERFWLGPEGGQFAIFFKKGDKFDLEHWQTPAIIDTESFDVVSKSKTHVSFRKKSQLKNMSGSTFDIQIDRTIKLLGKSKVQSLIETPIPDSVEMVAIESSNKVTNTGLNSWTKKTGMLSIWLLNMLKHSDETTVVIPFKPGSKIVLGPKVNDTYFGKVPADRLVVKDDVLFFSGDGKYRSKIGVSPKRAKPIIGSYDACEKVLTLVHYTLPSGATDYVNSMWEHQEDPFGGDVVNSYNDGPPAPGKAPLGPFFEIETSSPAAALQPGQTIQHFQRTIHLKGSLGELDIISRRTLGVSIEEITSAL